MSVINLRKVGRWRADEIGRRWSLPDPRQTIRSLSVRKVFFKGRDVTHRCFYFDTRRHVVRLFDVNEKGQKFVRDGEAAWQEHRGRVRVCWKAAA